MLFTFAGLLVFQCLGEGISYAFNLPIPGPVVGMLLLFFALIWSPKLQHKIEQTAHVLLSHLSLLFVPAGVGIIVSAQSVSGHWGSVLLTVFLSTFITLIVTALTMRACMPKEDKKASQDAA